MSDPVIYITLEEEVREVIVIRDSEGDLITITSIEEESTISLVNEGLIPGPVGSSGSPTEDV